ncbi:hypothetical protein [uncultured Gimesia sp.]|uniref:hypothetical protein n=1 Tax=uncultured Gimesia sp. TaxID=1678688 RepID=UPI0026265D92|nr:hypothetical protein [uncultured Gimesia sp.]
MGATGWTYYCPYNSDANAELQKLRDDVFTRRDYSLPGDLINQTDDGTLKDIAPPVADLKKLLKISKSLDEALGGLGFDTEQNKKQNKKTEAFINKINKEGFASAAKGMLGSKASQAPTSIEEALEISEEAGTHSILDIHCISPTPEPGAATPLSESQSKDLFGTTKPTLKMCQSADTEEKLTDLCDRWQAVFFPVYEDGKAVQYMFAGVSGD